MMMIVTFGEAVCDGWESNVCRPERSTAPVKRMVVVQRTQGSVPPPGNPPGLETVPSPNGKGDQFCWRMNNTVHQKRPIVLTW